MKKKKILLDAIKKGDIFKVKEVLDAGADPNSTYNHEQSSALMFAVLYCNHHIVRLLVERGADINYKNKYGVSAISLANSKCDKKTRNLLKKALKQQKVA